MSHHWHERIKEGLGDFAVPCLVSERWLQFSDEGSARFEDGEYLTLGVMTRGADDRPRELCELIVTREDILEVLNRIERTPERIDQD